MSIIVSVAQFAAGTDIAANIEQCASLAARAAADGADLVVLPECAMYFDPATESPAAFAQSLDGHFVRAMSVLAATHGLAILVGMTEALRDDRRAANTLVAIDHNGQLIGTYRKVHLFDAFGVRESDTILAGDIAHPFTFQIGDTIVGALTCYDLRFPEAFRWVIDAGADVVALPAAWAAGQDKTMHWRTLIGARAIENTVYVAAADQTGPLSSGDSRIVDPAGRELAAAGTAVGIATASIDPRIVSAVRSKNPSLQNRRFVVATRS